MLWVFSRTGCKLSQETRPRDRLCCFTAVCLWTRQSSSLGLFSLLYNRDSLICFMDRCEDSVSLYVQSDLSCALPAQLMSLLSLPSLAVSLSAQWTQVPGSLGWRTELMLRNWEALCRFRDSLQVVQDRHTGSTSGHPDHDWALKAWAHFHMWKHQPIALRPVSQPGPSEWRSGPGNDLVNCRGLTQGLGQ